MRWPLILRTGFGNVFTNGRWDHDAAVLIAAAYNDGDWKLVEEFAMADDGWDDETAN